MLFDNNNTLMYKFICKFVFSCFMELATVTPHFVATSMMISMVNISMDAVV